MPVHDWSRVEEGTFHFFRQRWVQALAESFNQGGLPPHLFAMTQRAEYGNGTTGYANRGDRVTVNQTEEHIVSVIDIVAPGNKGSAATVNGFAHSIQQFIRRGVHVMVIDLLGPSKWDSHGIHPAIWRAFDSGPPFQSPAPEPLSIVSYSAGTEPAAYLERLRVGQSLPEMPLFLAPDRYVSCLLEATYQETWRVFPQHLRTRIENPPAG